MSEKVKNSSQTIVALDNMNKEQVSDFLEQLPREFEWVKVGLELYLAHGRELVQSIAKKYERKIFLDLKLHDIPNTVAKAIGSLSDLPVDLITVHLSGGRAMLEAIQKIRKEKMPHVNILGVSYLTSLDNKDLLELFSYDEGEIEKAFSRLFTLACETGTQGIVCSPHELELVKKVEESHSKLIKVCPGIRFQDEIQEGQVGDQKRIMTPQKAIQKGADFIVMGRSITQAKDISKRLHDLNT